MKQIVVSIFFLGLVTNLQAQNVLIKKRIETPAPQVKTPTTKVKTVVVEKPVYIESNTNKFTLKLTCTASAKVLIDGEDKGIIAAGAFKKILLSKGKYYLTLISTANSTDQIKQTYEVANVNTEDLLEIDLQSIIDKRVLEEEQIIVAEKEKIRQKEIAREQERERIRQKEIAKEKENAKASAIKNAISDISNNMVYVEGGSFKMGGAGREPIHSVTLSSFSMGKYEVTQVQWQSVMETNPSEFKGCLTCPVENVSWDDVQEFLQKLNEETGKHYSLPTEAEWEYAARGGNKSNAYTYSGSNSIESVAWYEDNSGSKPHSVGQQQANELGIYDMTGNVWEWCSDWYAGNYYSNSPSSNPIGPSGGNIRVLRGCSWIHDALYCRVANRGGSPPETRSKYGGFRLVLVP